jgi:Fic family protein
MKPAMELSDRDERIGSMEPLLINQDSRFRRELTDLAVQLARKSEGFRRSLPESIASSLADLVRSMNCYYSNLIEGHDTHPVDIERALLNDYSADSRKRDLQIEAKAYINVQQWIDRGGLAGYRSVSAEGIREIHRMFCANLPDELLWTSNGEPGGERVAVTPGEWRTRDVQVGRHVAVSPGAVPRFMQRFEQVYQRPAGITEAILSMAAIHHRLVWIHPFLDGNGRVARLVSHALLLDSLSTGAIWSVARGLARKVSEYKTLLANCDQPRRNDLDGRGSLSEEALAAFTRFFLNLCIDQVEFMESLARPEELRTRILVWAEEESRLDRLPPKSGRVLEAILYRGELPRGEVEAVVATGDRQARRITSALLERGVLRSESTRAPLRLAFPATLAGRWMPGLFPDKIE